MDKQTQQKLPVVLLLKGELLKKLNVSKAQMNSYLMDGMPHYMIGNEYRFLENEVLKWIESYQPSQERLESDFRDKKGRTLEEYVTEDTVLTTLRITKETLMGLCKKGMPFERVGERDFFHIQDILDRYRKGTRNTVKQNPTIDSKKAFLMPLCDQVPKEVPFIIIDGSYDFNHKAGSGLVLVEKWDTATGISYVREIKTTKPHVCEFFALLDALRLIKRKKFKKTIVVTDQASWCNGIALDVNTYEGQIKTYINELNQLLKEMKGKFVIKYVGDICKGNNNLLYQKAHLLSREYKKGRFEKLEFT